MFSNICRVIAFRTNLNNLNDKRYLYQSCINFAARKGTRERARKKKGVKVVEKKVGFIPHNILKKSKMAISTIDKHFDDSTNVVSCDNVYVTKYYRMKMYNFVEAIAAHRQTHHPTGYNVPDANVNVKIELNMTAEKKTRFLDKFQRIAMIPNAFDQNIERTILVFCKGEAKQKEATDAGATLVGGPELIKDVQSGELSLSHFNYIIAHPNILPELVAIRGLMKRKFPNVNSGNLGVEVGELVRKFYTGIQYYAIRDEHQLNYGSIDTCVGKLNMNEKHLEENLDALLKDINSIRPKRDGAFITRCLVTSPPSGEALQIDPFVYISREYNPHKDTQDDDAVESGVELSAQMN
uniref:Putative 50s ribosomal protein l1 n=1 Tax=Xenopsylla cheopis TaxID=163159 RepID=A0A6M2DR53_XENCH